MNSECRLTGEVASIRTFNSAITFGMVFLIAWLIFAVGRFPALLTSCADNRAYHDAGNLEVTLSVDANDAMVGVAADWL